MTNNCRKIARTIGRTWEQGIALLPDTLFFLDSTFGISTAEALQAALHQEDFADREMILEFLLFPDDSIRLAIESLLDCRGLKHEQVAGIINDLLDTQTGIRLIHAQGPVSITVKNAIDQIQLFVTRLFLSRSLDTDICQCLEALLPKPLVLSSRCHLRCKGLVLTKEKKEILTLFIKNAGDRVKAFEALFETTLEILAQAPETESIEACFLKKREQEKKMLESIHRFEEKQERYGMEYLMMSKYPVPPDSLENTTERLQRLNVIIDEILGLFSMPAPRPLVRNLGNFDPQKDMEKLLKHLS